MTVVALDADRRRAVHLAAELGRGWVQPEDVADRAVARAAARPTRDPLLDAVRDVISADLLALGTEPARRRVVDLWAGPVLTWCRFGAGRGVDPDDAAQEVLVRALRDLERLRDPGAVGAWLWRTTWNVLREQERGPWRRWVEEVGARLGLADPTPTAPERMVEAEDLQQVQAALATLPVETRALLWGVYVDGRTRAELAAHLGLAEGTLNRRLTAAREAFRRAVTAARREEAR